MSTNSTFARRGLATGAILAAGTLALTACGGSAGGDGDDESAGHGDIAVQQSWIKNEEFAGEFYATKYGYYEEAGFGAVDLIDGPDTGVAGLLSGQLDIAINDAIVTGAAIANEDAPLTIVGATFQKSPFTILSLADGGNIETVDDLAGKRIGVQDSNAALFQALLDANGIDESELEVVPVQFDPSPLTNGEVDGFFAYTTNEALTVELAGNEITNLTFADNGMPFVVETFTVTDQFLAENRELVKDFLVAEIKGWAQVLNDPEAAADLVVDEFGTDLDPVKTQAGMQAQLELIVSEDTEANGLFTVTDELQQQTIDSLATAGHEVAAEDLFDLSLLDEVYEENPELVDYAALGADLAAAAE
ncbi:ABC transporter substrate-binding protein [Microbacterium karelineae]|uniref:ABC transporter substrate-binding protein n=1 Tax=Microbacterium karelineae TaxID=2654283 RepID=UPI0012E9F9A0|nr:ABC transporter substrate-binding protein [Microbacterium karelineae]